MSAALIQSVVYRHLVKHWPDLAGEFKQGLGGSSSFSIHTDLDMEEIVDNFNKTCIANYLVYKNLVKRSSIMATEFRSNNFCPSDSVSVIILENNLKELEEHYLVDSGTTYQCGSLAEP